MRRKLIRFIWWRLPYDWYFAKPYGLRWQIFNAVYLRVR